MLFSQTVNIINREGIIMVELIKEFKNKTNSEILEEIRKDIIANRTERRQELDNLRKEALQHEQKKNNEIKRNR